MGMVEMTAQDASRAEGILDAMDHLVVYVDGGGHVLHANAAARGRLLPGARLPPGEAAAPDRTLSSAFAVEHRLRLRRALRQACDGLRPPRLEGRLLAGDDAWLEIDVVPAASGALVVARDLPARGTARTAVASQCEVLRETLTSLLDTVPVGIVISDGCGAPRLVNRTARELLGMHALEPLSRWLTSGVFRRPDGGRLRAEDVPAALTLLDGRSRREIALEVPGPDGESVPVLLNTEALRGPDGAILEVCCTLTDVRERRHVERQLQQAQKMEAVAALAGGIAHDFNNILCAITGYSEMALLQCTLDERARDILAQIKKTSDRAAALTRKLLALGRRQALAPRPIDINRELDDLAPLLGRLVPASTEIVQEHEALEGCVVADPGHVEQILLNLAVNAAHAIGPRAGRIAVRTRREEVRHPGRIPLAPGPYAVLSVEDNGCGMGQDTRERIFEPFFTTRDAKTGTGLGLATVYAIVQQLRGGIDVRTRLGHGTRMDVYLPLVPRTDASPCARPAVAPSLVAGTGRILLVEDDDLVRRLIRQILEDAGYAVVEAPDGVAALAAWRGDAVASPGSVDGGPGDAPTRPAGATGGTADGLPEPAEPASAPWDLLVTDLVMPRMGGVELARRLRRLRPDLHVLYVSGYAGDARVGSEDAPARTAFLPKPFDAETLRARVHDLLAPTATA